MRQHFTDNEKTRKSFNNGRCTGICKIQKRISFGYPFANSGSVLLSRAVAHQVSSALKSLTTVFGMGTGVTSLLLPPNIC